MKYYIYEGSKTKEVDEHTYHEWEMESKYNYNFEDYILVLDDVRISIQVTYIGVFDDLEEPKPFVLLYSEKKHGEKEVIKRVEYYETYEAVNTRKAALKQLIKDEYIKTVKA